MNDPRITQFSAAADKVLHFLRNEYGKLQIGRANASLLEHISVDAYGQKMELKAVASVAVQDARSLVVQPWDKTVLQAVEKALQQANLGVNPVNDGVVLRINLPAMTEERRKELVKIVHKLAEEARISVRQHRQESHDGIKDEKDEDVRETLQETLQKEVDRFNEQIDDIRKKKEEEIMTV